MGQGSAIVFISDDSAREGLKKPLMLQELMFCPLAAWTAESLTRLGAERFFLVCHEQYQQEAAACFPQGAEVITAGAEDPRGLLSRFLEGQEGPLFVVTRPVLLEDRALDILASEEPLHPEGAETGLFRLSAADLREALNEDEDLIPLLNRVGEPAVAEMGIRLLDRLDRFQEAQETAKLQVVRRHMARGVLVLDPNCTYVDPRVEIGRGTRLLPGTILRGQCRIGEDCEIGPNSMIRDCTVGDGTVVNASQLNESTVGSHTKIGPFAYVRPGCTIGDDIKVGDFVEVKNSVLKDGVKISHLTYVGDSDIGANVNLGCGTVTVNYDGKKKDRCVVEDDAFVGCNSNLIAPVKVGRGAYIAAGSTINKDVPADSLAIARSRQTVKNQWAARRRGKP